MIILIGTGHVFDLSQSILSILDRDEVDAVGVELDEQRYNALLMKKRDPAKYKESTKDLPFVYRLLARFQQQMAKKYGVEPGDEMVTAIDYAKSHQLPLFFVDMNAQFLFNKMLRSMSWVEKLRLLFSGITGFFVSKKGVERELNKIERNFDDYIDKIGEKFPTVKNVLIDERNRYIVDRILEMDEEYEKGVVVMGDGHIPGVSDLLEEKGVDFETVRLKDLRDMNGEDVDGSSASFSFEYDGFNS